MLDILHFVVDDKFINDSILCFESAKLTNNQYVYVSNKKRTFHYIKSDKVKILTEDNVLNLFHEGDINAICLHSFMSLPTRLIVKIPSNVKVLWFGWGFDYYSNPRQIGNFLNIGNRFLPYTNKIVNKNIWLENIVKDAKLKLKIILKREPSSSKIYEAVKRIDYFSGVFPIEYSMLKASLTCFQAKQIIHNYIHPEEFKKEDIDSPLQLKGSNVLLGNSATFYINHIDLMYMIKDRIDKDVNIIAPLSYQGSPSYIDKVIKEGKCLFGERFIPIKDYLPFDEYTAIMNSCDTLILGQKQQAATCNCLTAMWNGLKVFFLKDSMNYEFYKSMKLKVFSLEDDFGSVIDYNFDDVHYNREIIEKHYSYRAWVDDLINTIDTIKK